jgi:hypothetical protein
LKIANSARTLRSQTALIPEPQAERKAGRRNWGEGGGGANSIDNNCSIKSSTTTGAFAMRLGKQECAKV